MLQLKSNVHRKTGTTSGMGNYANTLIVQPLTEWC